MYFEKSKLGATTRVRIVEKQRENGVWKKRLIRHIGTAKSDTDLEFLMEKAKEALLELKHKDQLRLPFPDDSSLSGLRTVGEYHQGADLVLGGLFDRLGIPLGNVALLRQLIMARILHPTSKRRTAQFLNRSFGATLDEEKIYRFMDSISKSQSKILAKTRDYVTSCYPGSFGYILYDVTTLYFETDTEDEDQYAVAGFRKRGYSKDKREDLPQVVLGLGVNSLGMPLTFKLYPGNTYEGSTLISGIDETLETLGQSSLTVVGDAGMLSEKNLSALEQRNLFYIVGARLKSLPKPLQEEILGIDFTDTTISEITYKDRRLIVSYSASRAKRAANLRKRSIARLEALIAKNQAVRKHQFLDFSYKEKPKIDLEAIDAASRWDGIKGYVTNNFELGSNQIIDHYGELDKIEQSFRMSKTDLKIRPAFHFIKRRIEAHVIICMLSLCVLRMLGQEAKPLGLSYKQALDEISSAKAAILSLGERQFLVPPAYGPTMQQLIRSLESGQTVHR